MAANAQMNILLEQVKLLIEQNNALRSRVAALERTQAKNEEAQDFLFKRIQDLVTEQEEERGERKKALKALKHRVAALE